MSLRRFTIERDIPDLGPFGREQLAAAAARRGGLVNSAMERPKT